MQDPHLAPFAELAVTTNYSFLRGASHPEEFVQRAFELGHSAAAIADRNSLAGVVRAHTKARELEMPLAIGARLVFAARDGEGHAPPDVLAFATSRASYAGLSRLLTVGKLRAAKGECHLTLDDLAQHVAGLELVVMPPQAQDGSTRLPIDSFHTALHELRWMCDAERLTLAVTQLGDSADRALLRELQRAGKSLDIPLCASFDAHLHDRSRRPLQDVLTSIRHGSSLQTAGLRLFPNNMRRLRTPNEAGRSFGHNAKLLARAAEIAERAADFSLGELNYRYPRECTGVGTDAQTELVRATWEGARRRYPDGISANIRNRLEHEFALVADLQYAPYFLTVYDLVRFARQQGILCQGRGAAANSSICYCLEVTAVDPDRTDLLFERFISKERDEPPDIDIDFEHERREEVIQYVYNKYGRLRAALTATVIKYRGRSAVRDVGKALGFSLDFVDRVAKELDWWSDSSEAFERLKGAGFEPEAPVMQCFLALVNEIVGFPRHLSQHVGGFVMTDEPLSEIVPIENAAMPNRTVIEWDKDDIDELGILKVDILGLGMLTAIQKSFELVASTGEEAAFTVPTGGGFTMHTIPPEDPAVYDMLCAADTVGVFQVESRAQMSMLPRLRPREFYDLVIEIAIVRPGPVHGDMVHPYLRRRSGLEPVDLPSPEVRQVLERTLGVPLFQEQAMALAVVAAGFTPNEADQLRRAMAAWKRKGDVVERFGKKLISGMVARGYERDFAQRVYRQFKGFSEYGFPESHAASFALLVYVSAWLKLYYPAAFCGALLNSQPMGFYGPSQLVRDAQEHGVEVRPIDVLHSRWDCTLEPSADAKPALRLGLRMVKGLRREVAERVVDVIARHGPPNSLAQLHTRCALPAKSLKPLAYAGAFRSLELDRQASLWAVRGLRNEDLPLFAHLVDDTGAGAQNLPAVSSPQRVRHDYASHGLSLENHPLAFLRQELSLRGAIPACELASEELAPQHLRVRVAGIVLVRQRPITASGITFMTLEDETGVVNLVVHSKTFERHRAVARHSVAVYVEGRVDREGSVVHVIAQRFENLDLGSAELEPRSRDFR